MTNLPRVLILDNSPRQLGRLWFPKWLNGKLGCEVSTYHIWGGSRIRSLDGFDALVLSGSPASATEDQDWILHEVDLVREAEARGMPVMGVCFGSQLVARAFYGPEAIRRSNRPEFGWHTVKVLHNEEDPIFNNTPSVFTTFQYHMEEVLPQQEMRVLACNDNADVQAFRVADKLVWGLQFHLEVTPRAGRDLLLKTQHVYERFGFEYEELVALAQPNPATEQLFRNFIRTWRG
jgi:GMP synthase (glutamine-hydrolysing)